MRSKAILMALLALAFGAWGAPVSDDTARLAASSWAVSDASLGVPHGKTVGEARVYSVDGTNGFYAISLEGGGTLFLAADDEIDPVLAFTAAANVDLSEKSPLRNLLNRDIAARRRKLTAESQVIPPLRASFAARPAAVSAPVASESRAKKLWAAFTEDSQESSGQSNGGRVRLLATADPRKSIAVSDMRVEPFLASNWSQTRDKSGNLCYNYYTPNNYPCGCVATATGQILYRWKWPQGSLPKFSGDCIVDKVPTTLESHGDSRLYDWNAMVGVPGLGTPEEGRQAIGALLYDLGVAFKSDYAEDGTGAYERDVAGPLHEHFGFASAYTYSSRDMGTMTSSLHTAPTRQKVIFANLDAKRPVELYIMSEAVGGHAVVADGYGYVNISGEEVEFTHINMGWAGTDDMWYNLPIIKTEESGSQAGQSGGYTFEYLTAATFNIHPTETGDLLTGRITGGDDLPIENATVAVYQHGSGVSPIAVTNSDAHGIYSFTLPGGTEYDIVAATPDGRKKGILEGVLLKATTISDTTTFTTAVANDIGNSWGNDIVILDPRVRIVVGSETNGYSSLDAAIAGARAIAASTGIAPEMEILRDVSLNADVTLDFPCSLRAAGGDESSTLVSRPTGATITVAFGAEFLVSNCVFEATGRVPLVAAAGGKVIVGPDFAAERVAAEDAYGFNVVGSVTSGMAVECVVATDIGHVFGMATTDDPAALEASVSLLYATFDEEHTVRGGLLPVSPGVYRLVWVGAPVPVEDSVGYFVFADGTTNASAKVDSLFAQFENSREAGLLGPTPEIVLIGHDENGLSRDIVVSSPLTIRGEGGAYLSPTESAHIIVTNGGRLAVADVTIGGRTGDTFVRILDGGFMRLDSGAVLTNLVCSGNDVSENIGSSVPVTGGLCGEFVPVPAGPIAVTPGGSMTLGAGSKIVACAAAGSSLGGKHGGGVYICQDATLDLAGGSIVGCASQYGYGGGVYAALGADIVVSGPSVVSGNLGKNGATDNIYILCVSGAAGADTISVTNSAASGSMGVRFSDSAGNRTNFVFATMPKNGFGSGVASNSAAAFFCDVNPARRGLSVLNGSFYDFKWSEEQSAPDSHLGDVVRVEYPNGQKKNFDHVRYAFESLEGVSGSATVTLLRDDWFDTDIAVEPGCSVTLTSSGTAKSLLRMGGKSILVGEGASLTVLGVVLTNGLSEGATEPLFAVGGGSLEFLSGAKVLDIPAEGRFGAAVTVTDGGTFTMRDGALISGCENTYMYVSDRTAYAGALLVDGTNSTAILAGGSITNCLAWRAGGVCVANGGEVRFSGKASVFGNFVSQGVVGNVVVADCSSLVLDGVLTGYVGDRADVGSDRALIGTVGAGFAGSDADLVASAMMFRNDEGYGYGVPVRADDTTLLVWSGYLSLDGTYTDSNGIVYALVMSSSVPYQVDPPEAESLVYNGLEQVGVVAGFGYVLSETCVATDAGTYTAVATLASGCVWSDGTTVPKEISWTIAKAQYDMEGVLFADGKFLYDGTPKALSISGELPDGVTVSYSGEDWTQPGAYVVTATFLGDSGNYEDIPPMTATLTIVRAIAAPALVATAYNAAEQTGVAAGEGYTLSGEVSGVDAGVDYVAVATLDDYFVWEDGSSDPLEIVWSISPAPLTITAMSAWKLLGEDDPVPFAYKVSGLQGADTAADVLEGALVRVQGESLGTYAIYQGSLALKDGEKNYVLAEYQQAFFRILLESPSIFPDLGGEATPEAVAAVLDAADLADDSVAEAINGSDDPVAAYNDFREWVATVEGGEEAVASSEHAWVSYEFGVTELFENVPSVTFTSMAVEDPAEASMRVTLIVKDGDAEKVVDPASVAKLFEMSANLVTWTGDLTATANPDGSYTVKPNDPTLPAAFIRLKY